MKLETGVSSTLTLMVAIVPLVILPFLTDPVYYAKILVVYLSLMLLILICLRDLSRFIVSKPKIPLGTGMGLLYFTAITLTLFFSVNPLFSMIGAPFRAEGYLSLATYVVLMLLASFFYEFKIWHAWALGISAGIVSLIAIFKFFGLDLVPIVSRVLGAGGKTLYTTIGNPNFLGSYLSLMLPIFVFLFVKTKKRYCLIPSALIYFALLCSNTRGTWIGSFIGFSFLVFLIIKKKINPKKLITVSLLFILLTGVFFLNNSSFFARFSSVFLEFSKFVSIMQEEKKDEESLGHLGSSRIYIWDKTWQLIKKRPFTGYGIETMGEVMEEYFAEDNQHYFKGPVILDKAHNEYLHIAFSSGIFAALAYLAFELSVMVTGMKALKKEKNALIILPLLCSVLGYLCQSLMNISVVSVAFIFWIFLGVIIKLSTKSLGQAKKKTDQLN